MLVEEIRMFGSTGTNLYGSVLVADWCLWIDEFQPWWIGVWIVIVLIKSFYLFIFKWIFKEGTIKLKKFNYKP